MSRRGVPRAEEMAIAAALKKEIVDLLTSESMSVGELSAVTGAKPTTVRDYLFRMAKAGQVTSVIKNGYKGSSTAAIYSLGTGGATRGGCEKIHRPVRTIYPQNHVRDELVAFLFGPAKQQNGDMTK